MDYIKVLRAASDGAKELSEKQLAAGGKYGETDGNRSAAFSVAFRLAADLLDKESSRHKTALMLLRDWANSGYPSF